MKHLEDYIDVKTAVANSVTSTSLVGTAVDTTGFSRARFVFQLGGQAGIGALNASSVAVWKANTSGATYAAIAGAYLNAVTSGVLSGGAVAIIDVPTDPDNEWLKVSGSLTSSNMYHSAIVELYNGVSNPPTSSANHIVTL